MRQRQIVAMIDTREDGEMSELTFFLEGFWTLIGRRLPHDEFRHFRVDHVAALTVSDEHIPDQPG